MFLTEYILNFISLMYFKHNGTSFTNIYIYIYIYMPGANNSSVTATIFKVAMFLSLFHQNYIRNVTDFGTYCCALFHDQSCTPGLQQFWYSWLWEFRNTRTWWPKMARVHTKFPENVWTFSNLQKCLTHRDCMVIS